MISRRTWPGVSSAPGGPDGARRQYLSVSSVFILTDDVLDAVRSGELVRVAVDGRISDLSATELGPDAIQEILPSLLHKRLRVEAEGARWDPEPRR